jgi:hypothetical protein
MRVRSSEKLKARWVSGDPTLKPPVAAIQWDDGLDSALRALVGRQPSLSWDKFSEAMGISIEACRRRMAMLGLTKPTAPRRGRPKGGERHE